jgi:hypothetical protein
MLRRQATTLILVGLAAWTAAACAGASTPDESAVAATAGSPTTPSAAVTTSTSVTAEPAATSDPALSVSPPTDATTSVASTVPADAAALEPGDLAVTADQAQWLIDEIRPGPDVSPILPDDVTQAINDSLQRVVARTTPAGDIFYETNTNLASDAPPSRVVSLYLMCRPGDFMGEQSCRAEPKGYREWVDFCSSQTGSAFATQLVVTESLWAGASTCVWSIDAATLAAYEVLMFELLTEDTPNATFVTEGTELSRRVADLAMRSYQGDQQARAALDTLPDDIVAAYPFGGACARFGTTTSPDRESRTPLLDFMVIMRRDIGDAQSEFSATAVVEQGIVLIGVCVGATEPLSQ